jgi:hypothetical protein
MISIWNSRGAAGIDIRLLLFLFGLFAGDDRKAELNTLHICGNRQP